MAEGDKAARALAQAAWAAHTVARADKVKAEGDRVTAAAKAGQVALLVEEDRQAAGTARVAPPEDQAAARMGEREARPVAVVHPEGRPGEDKAARSAHPVEAKAARAEEQQAVPLVAQQGEERPGATRRAEVKEALLAVRAEVRRAGRAQARALERRAEQRVVRRERQQQDRAQPLVLSATREVRQDRRLLALLVAPPKDRLKAQRGQSAPQSERE